MSQLIDQVVAQSAIEDRVRAWCVAITELVTIIAHPEAPRPQPPYAMLNIISAMRRRRHSLGPIYYEILDDGGEGEDERIVATKAEEWEWTISTHLYGAGALDHARRLINSLQSGTVLVDYLDPLYLSSASLVRRVPELVNNKWENRANFDLTLHGVVLDGYLVDVVEHGEINIIRRLFGTTDVGSESVVFGEPPLES